MKRHIKPLLLILACLIFSFPIKSFSQSLPIIHTKAQRYTELLNTPVGFAVANDGSDRKFIIEQTGCIRIVESDILLSVNLVNLKQKLDGISSIYSEKGLLGLAFHPQFKQNKKFYVYYSAVSSTPGMNNKSVVAEFKISDYDRDVSITEGKTILEIDEPEANHNGGCLAFGKDGFLYIGVGDGGGSGDKHGEKGNGQNLKTLLGKILRIDVNTQPYSIPKDNPFVNTTDAKGEIWAYGLRNPWRFSFDKTTGLLFCGDVGQDKYEEINLIEKGKNYGWRVMEGNHCYSPKSNCPVESLATPITEYNHEEGNCVIGGFVYRGKKFPNMVGKYIFGDWTGRIFYLEKVNGKWLRGEIKNLGEAFNEKKYYINSFGEDEDGELYIVASDGIGPRHYGVIFRFITFDAK